jgi:hypothetical protein
MNPNQILKATNQINELKKELYVSKLDQYAHLDAEYIELLKRVARLDDDVLQELGEILKEAK